MDGMCWKHSYLQLANAIKGFTESGSFAMVRNHFTDLEQGNIARLLQYHLDRSRELLIAEVNGGLEELYQDEADRLQDEL